MNSRAEQVELGDHLFTYPCPQKRYTWEGFWRSTPFWWKNWDQLKKIAMISTFFEFNSFWARVRTFDTPCSYHNSLATLWEFLNIWRRSSRSKCESTRVTDICGSPEMWSRTYTAVPPNGSPTTQIWHDYEKDCPILPPPPTSRHDSSGRGRGWRGGCSGIACRVIEGNIDAFPESILLGDVFEKTKHFLGAYSERLFKLFEAHGQWDFLGWVVCIGGHRRCVLF